MYCDSAKIALASMMSGLLFTGAVIVGIFFGFPIPLTNYIPILLVSFSPGLLFVFSDSFVLFTASWVLFAVVATITLHAINFLA